ncbi:hypothetical protein QOT17_007945 [Balamuthia mandrillaris]
MLLRGCGRCLAASTRGNRPERQSLPPLLLRANHGLLRQAPTVPPPRLSTVAESNARGFHGSALVAKEKRDEERKAEEQQPPEKMIMVPLRRKKKVSGDTFTKEAGVLLTTRGTLLGFKIVDEIGIVVGSSVKSRHVFHDIWARFRGIIGGEVKSYSELLTDATADATSKMLREAASRGANAVVRVRYQTSTSADPTVWSSSFCYTLAYGTAVCIEPVDRSSKTSHATDED